MNKTDGVSSAEESAITLDCLKEKMVKSLSKKIKEKLGEPENSSIVCDCVMLIIIKTDMKSSKRIRRALIPENISLSAHTQYMKIARQEIEMMASVAEDEYHSQIASSIGIADEYILLLIGPSRLFGQDCLIAAAEENGLLKNNVALMA